MPGTAETVALELVKVLEPLEERLSAPGGAVGLFAEMGLPLPPAVRAAIEGAAEVGQVAAEVTAVLAEAPVLAAAVAAEDAGAAAASLGRLVPHAVAAVDHLEGLAGHARTAFGDPAVFGAELRALIEQLPERLFDWLVVTYLERRRPTLFGVLSLPGIVQADPVAPAGADPGFVRRDLRLDRIPQLLSDPNGLLRDVYHWGDSATPLDSQLLLRRLARLLDSFGFFATLDPATPELHAFVFSLRPGTGGPPTPLDLNLLLSSMTDIDLPLIPPGGPLEAHLRGQGSLELGAGVRIDPPASLTPIAPTGAVSGELALTVGRAAPGGGRMLLFGQLNGTRLTATGLSGSAGADFSAGTSGLSADMLLEGALEQGQLVVAFGGADNFLSTFLPGTAQLDLDLAVRYTPSEGLSFRGGAALAVTIPLALRLGPLHLDRLVLAARPAAGPPPALAIETRASGGIDLGVFAASVEGLGVGVDLLLRGGSSGGTPPPGAIDLGPVALAFRFLPPSGLGLAIDAGPVRGGGFIGYDDATGRYSGIFDVRVSQFGVTAVGLLDTRPPGGGFALLIVLRGQFPPIQVGFGFALSSIGGLLGLNRRIDIDALRARFATGTVGRILAPENPVRDAPILLADLGAVFPPAGGVVIVGPTLQLSWVEIARFDLGIFIELPQFKVVLLGSLRVGIPSTSGGRPILQIRADIIGLLDPAKKVLEFDAVLVDSVLLAVLELTGGAAFRLSWGDQPYVVLTVGGFHPSYSPAPLTFPPSLRRIAMVYGAPTDLIYLRLEGYFAVTTNTLQFGCAAELRVNAGPVNVRGTLAFDALIQFKPFHFEFSLEASVSIRVSGVSLLSVGLSGTLAGPGPVTFHGRVSIEILFFEISWEETFTLSSSGAPPISPVPNVVGELDAELGDPRNLGVSGGEDPHVAVDPGDGGGLPVARPLGQLVWTQSRAPLDLLLERFDGADLQHTETVTASGPNVTSSEDDWFAPGSFARLSDSEALNRPSFERLHGGVRIGASGVADGRSQAHAVTVQQIRLPHPPASGFDFRPPGWLQLALDARHGIDRPAAVTGVIAVAGESWTVVDVGGAVAASAVSQSQAHQLARSGVGVAVPADDRIPSLAL